MDPHIQRALNDKLYDKRKVGALEYVAPGHVISVLTVQWHVMRQHWP